MEPAALGNHYGDDASLAEAWRTEIARYQEDTGKSRFDLAAIEQDDKGAWIREVLTAMERQLSRFKAAVFWHKQWQNGDLSCRNLRVNSSLSTLNAYREGVSHAFWLPKPRYSPAVPALK